MTKVFKNIVFHRKIHFKGLYLDFGWDKPKKKIICKKIFKLLFRLIALNILVAPKIRDITFWTTTSDLCMCTWLVQVSLHKYFTSVWASLCKLIIMYA